MNFKCNECGTELVPGATECPSCGCPVTTVQPEQPTISDAEGRKFNVSAIISLILGVVIIIMGITVMNKDAELSTYHARQYDADSAMFGGDFYTEIYGATDIIVDELSDINGGVESLSDSMAEMVNLIYYPAGMIIIAIGIGVVALSCPRIKKEK